jgi:enoyl-[acyl-carrier protein] reductase I
MINLVNLEGRKGLIFGIANEHSIAYGIAKVLHGVGAEMAVTYLNEKAEPYVRPLAEQMNSPVIMPCDIQKAGQLEAVLFLISKVIEQPLAVFIQQNPA